ncbi:MAG: hypothetical protein A2V85_12980 [Chloroflexi bacterium RBG_16_72_14]|nr:MAG: hypothetical protein A2V85_12980 [Chloroflexi bacterium RBG_16_72_14]
MATPFDRRPRKWTKPAPVGRERSLGWTRQQAMVRERLAMLGTRPQLAVPTSRAWTRGLLEARARISQARASQHHPGA